MTVLAILRLAHTEDVTVKDDTGRLIPGGPARGSLAAA